MKLSSFSSMILLVSAFLFNLSGYAQVITTDPPFPTADEAVTITFDATQGSGNLAGYTGDVYAHTGVNIKDGGNWQFVIGNWGDNDEQPTLTRIDTDLYELEITPSIREFYRVPRLSIESPSEMQPIYYLNDIIEIKAIANLVITSMNFVFRAAGNIPQTEDLFVQVYEDGSFEVDSLALYINEQYLISISDGELNYNYLATSHGSQNIKVIAYYGNENTEVAEKMVFVVSEAPVAELPSGVINGINYINDNTVTLVLHDPPALKEFVFVLGDFNNWMVNEDFYMNRTPDGTRYWLTIENLEPSKEYIYQYYIDGELRLADPYTHKVIDPWHDHWIPESTYPGLISYPDGKTTGLAAVLQTAQTLYQWEVTDFTPPAPEDLVIYELLVRDFVATRDIKTLIDTLDNLERLGINAIGLMPVNEFEGNDSWGYNPSFYFATDKAYGRKQDYQRFIDECHKRGIAVILDMVLNHSFGQSPLVQMYFNPAAGQYGQPTSDNPWYNQICPHEPWCWGYDFDHHSPYTREFVDRVNTHWLTEFKFDGFRFDFTKGFTNQQTGNQGSNYDATRIAILKRMADVIWQVNPDAYVILEHFCENREEKELAEYGMMVWGNMNYAYNEATMGWMPGSNFSGVSYKNRGWEEPHLVGYMESHDEERLMVKNIAYGNSSNLFHDVKDTTVALQRLETAAAFFFTIPGPKMIWQFGELGYDYSINHCPDGTINDGCRTSPKPIRWDYLEDERRRQVYNVYSELIALKKEHDAFRTKDFNLSLAGAQKRIKLNHETMDVVVIGNFGVETGNASPQFQQMGWWYEYFSGDSINVTNVDMSIELSPAEYRLYSTVKLVDRPAVSVKNTLRIFPNPVEQEFTIAFTLDDEYQVVMDIYNLQGLQVASLLEGTYSKGKHSYSYSRPNHVAAGLYMVRMLFGNRVVSQKFIIP